MAVDIAIVLPVHNEQDGLENAIATIVDHIPGDKSFSVIAIDDGSSDKSWEILKKLCCDEKLNLVASRFSRNFGKEAAIFDGLQRADARCVIVMDSDLQHPPELIPQFLKIWNTGEVKIVEGVKRSRGEESFLKSLLVRLYYKLLRKLTGMDLSISSDYKLLDRAVVDQLLSWKEARTFFRANVQWFGFPTAQIPFDVQPRAHGHSSWGVKQNIRLGVLGVTTFSNAPLKLASLVSAVFFVLVAIFGPIALYQKIIGQAVEGFTTIILLQLIIGGMLFFSLGIVGKYLAIISEDLKGRPRACVSEVIESKKV